MQLLCPCFAGDITQVQAAIGVIGVSGDTDDTLWAKLKAYRDLCSPGEQELFGAYNSVSPKTIFGRVNFIMDLLRAAEEGAESVPADFIGRLENNEDSLLKYLDQGDFAVGNWFDHSNSCFGMLHELSSILLRGIQFSEDSCSNELCKVAQSLITQTLPYADAPTVSACAGLVEAINAAVQGGGAVNPDSPYRQSLYNLFSLLFPLYIDIAIGEDKAPPSALPSAPLFAAFNANKESSFPDVASFVEERLHRLKNMHPLSLEQFADFVRLTRCDGETSLSSCLLGEVGSPFNTETCEDRTFFTIFNEVAQRCYSAKEKFKILIDTIGATSNTEKNETVFGSVASVLHELETCPASTYKRKWIGEKGGTGFSLFSNLEEILGRLSVVEGEFDDAALFESSIDEFIKLIGIYGDTNNSSLFGAIYYLKGCEDFASFSDAFGFEEGGGNSCFYYINLLKKLTAPTLFRNQAQLPNLTSEILAHLFGGNAAGSGAGGGAESGEGGGAESDDVAEFARCSINLDCEARLTNWILPQLRGLYNILQYQDAEVFSFIGNPWDNDMDKFTISSRIHRLIKHLQTSKDFDALRVVDACLLYPLLFHGENSLQSKIYEIHTKVTHTLPGIKDVVGTVTSLDNSMFGLVNKCLRLFEAEPILRLMFYNANNPELSGGITKNVLKVCENFANKADDLSSLISIIGNTYEPHKAKINTLIDVIAYIYEIFGTMSSLLTYEELVSDTELILGEGKSLLQQSKDIAVTNNRANVTGITGYASGDTPGQMWSSCRSICKGFYARIHSILTNAGILDESVNAGEMTSHFSTFLSNYQSKMQVMSLFASTALIERNKCGIDEIIVNLFQNSCVPQGEFTDFAQLLESEHVPLYNSIYFKIQSLNLEKDALLETNAQSLQQLDDEITKLIHVFFVEPHLRYLTIQGHDIFDPSGRAVPNTAYLSGVELLRKITESFPSLESFNFAKELIGRADDDVSDASLKNITVYGRFNEIMRMLSSPSFFLSSTESLTDVTSKHWCFTITKVIGSGYDANSSASDATLFRTLSKVISLFGEANVEEFQELTSKIIGTRDEYEAVHESVFAILNELLAQLVPSYAEFIFGYDASYVDSVRDSCVAGEIRRIGAVMADIYRRFQSISYQHASSFQPLSQMGDPDTPSGVFLRLSECVDAFQTQPHWVPLSVNFLIAYSKILSDEVANFASDMASSMTKESVEEFLANVDMLIIKILSLESCESCEQTVDFLRNLYAKMTDAAQSLSGLSNGDLITLFSNKSFGEVKNAVCGLKDAVSALGKKTVQNTNMQKQCIAWSSQGEFAVIESKMEELSVAVRALMGAAEVGVEARVVVPEAYNATCQSLPGEIVKLSGAINLFAGQLRTPTMQGVVYNEENEKDFVDIYNALVGIFGEVKNILNLKNCSGCKDKDLGFSLFVGEMQQFIDAVGKINKFIEDSYSSQLAYQLNKIAQTLQKTSTYTVDVDLTKMPEITRTIWEGIAENSTQIAENVANVFAELQVNESLQNVVLALDSLNNALDVHLSYLKELSGLMGADAGLDAGVDAGADAGLDYDAGDGLLDESSYDAASIITTFDTFRAHTSHIAQYWDNSDLNDPLESYWIIPILEKINSAYKSMQSVLVNKYPTWENKYGITSSFNEIRELFEQGICGNIEETIQRLKDLCPYSFAEQMKNVAFSVAVFSSLLTQISPEAVFSKSANIDSFLTQWGVNTQKIAKILSTIRSKQSTHLDFCLHFSISEDINNLWAVVEKENVNTESLMSLQGNAVVATSLVDSIDQMRTGLCNVNGWLQNILDLQHKLDTCYHPLSSALMLLQASYASIGDELESITQGPVCMYVGISFEDMAPVIRGRAQQIEQILQILNSDLACTRHIEESVGAVGDVLTKVRDMLGAEADLGAASGSEASPGLEAEALGADSDLGGDPDLGVEPASLDKIVKTQSFPVFLEVLANINDVVRNLAAFFDAATEGACIDGVVPFLTQIHDLLGNVVSELDGEPQPMEVGEVDVGGIEEEGTEGDVATVNTTGEGIAGQIQRIDACVYDIGQRLLLQSITMGNSRAQKQQGDEAGQGGNESGGEAGQGDGADSYDYAHTIDQIFLEARASADLLVKLSHAMESAAPAFASCFRELSELSGRIKLLRNRMTDLSIAIQSIFGQVESSNRQVTFANKSSYITNVAMIHGVSQSQWLNSVEQMSHDEREMFKLLSRRIFTPANIKTMRHPVFPGLEQ
jgi:hypothetical protein